MNTSVLFQYEVEQEMRWDPANVDDLLIVAGLGANSKDQEH